jgi:hypothetical protein
MTFENWVLMEVFGPKTEQVTRDWRKLYNEESCSVLLTECYFGGQIVVMWWVGHVAFGWGIEKCIQVLGGETAVKETTWKTWA